MDNFKEWFKENIIVDRFPVLKEIKQGKHLSIDIFINVSDELYIGQSQAIADMGKMSFYFPMGENGNDMGISSIFGALQVLHMAYEWDKSKKILLHCQAGVNRSPTIKAAFYYMMTGEHLEELSKGKIILTANRLKDNCGKYLPELSIMEIWLSNCKIAFDNPHKFLGGMYDWTLRKSGLNNV